LNVVTGHEPDIGATLAANVRFNGDFENHAAHPNVRPDLLQHRRGQTGDTGQFIDIPEWRLVSPLNDGGGNIRVDRRRSWSAVALAVLIFKVRLETVQKRSRSPTA
jgi:hypothetical protein